MGSGKASGRVVMLMTECWRCLLLDVQDGEKVHYRGSKCRGSRIEAPKCILETAQVRQRASRTGIRSDQED